MRVYLDQYIVSVSFLGLCLFLLSDLWLEEDNVSVVIRSSTIGSDFDTLDMGTECQVKQRSKHFSGKVAASGEKKNNSNL